MIVVPSALQRGSSAPPDASWTRRPLSAPSVDATNKPPLPVVDTHARSRASGAKRHQDELPATRRESGARHTIKSASPSTNGPARQRARPSRESAVRNVVVSRRAGVVDKRTTPRAIELSAREYPTARYWP